MKNLRKQRSYYSFLYLAYRLEEEIIECNKKMEEMNKAIEQSQECVKQRETNLANLQKQYNTLQYAYMKYC